MSCSPSSGVPVGHGVTWSQLLTVFWVSAASVGTLFLLCCCIDFATSRVRPSYSNEWYAGGRGPSLRDHAIHLTHPGRSTTARVVEVTGAFLCVAQFFFWVVCTYQDAPMEANAGIIVCVCVFGAFFTVRQALRLAACESGRLAVAALTSEHIIDVLATVGVCVTPFISGTWFSFSPLRLATLVYILFHLDPWLETFFYLSKFWRMLTKIVVELTVFMMLAASAIMTLERAGEPTPAWGTAVQGNWAVRRESALCLE
jgi:hypothetical protein